MKGDYVDVRLRVRYAETDRMGRAYYANYLVWFEVGRTSLCRARGVVYARLEEESQTFLPVIRADCRYRKPLCYDEEFLVRTNVALLRSRKMIFSYQLISPDEKIVYAEGSTEHVFTDSRGLPKSLPKAYRELLV